MNSPFQNQLITDITNVFLNLNEFGETHNINNIEDVPCLIDTDSVDALRPGLGKYDGTFKETIMLLIPISELTGEPAYNEMLIVDKHNYRVKQCNACNGLYEISLEAVK